MSCEHLICAQCAGPVVEGRCPACRASRDHVHNDHSGASPQLIIAAILALAFVLLLALQFARYPSRETTPLQRPFWRIHRISASRKSSISPSSTATAFPVSMPVRTSLTFW